MAVCVSTVHDGGERATVLLTRRRALLEPS